MLNIQIQRYRNNEKYLLAYDMMNLLPKLKKQEEYSWLCGISAQSLQKECKLLDRDYKRFFNKNGKHPKYKSKKRSPQSYPVATQRFHFNNTTVQIPNVGEVKFKTDFSFPVGTGYKFMNVSIGCVNNKWILSFGMECENQAFVLSDASMGIDLGIKKLAVVAFGDNQFVYDNINKSSKMKKLERQIAYRQKSLSRKYLTNYRRTGKYTKTNNIIKEENKLRNLYAKQANIRLNYIHQTTHQLVAKLPRRVVMEDLQIRHMVKNRHLSKAIHSQRFSEFIRQMKYKCEWDGIQFVQADRFYPSSKTCSGCGSIKRDLKLSDRTYICQDCGLVIDRDYNAAINLMKYGTH